MAGTLAEHNFSNVIQCKCNKENGVAEKVKTFSTDNYLKHFSVVSAASHATPKVMWQKLFEHLQ